MRVSSQSQHFYRLSRVSSIDCCSRQSYNIACSDTFTKAQEEVGWRTGRWDSYCRQDLPRSILYLSLAKLHPIGTRNWGSGQSLSLRFQWILTRSSSVELSFGYLKIYLIRKRQFTLLPLAWVRALIDLRIEIRSSNSSSWIRKRESASWNPFLFLSPRGGMIEGELWTFPIYWPFFPSFRVQVLSSKDSFSWLRVLLTSKSHSLLKHRSSPSSHQSCRWIYVWAQDLGVILVDQRAVLLPDKTEREVLWVTYMCFSNRFHSFCLVCIAVHLWIHISYVSLYGVLYHRKSTVTEK